MIDNIISTIGCDPFLSVSIIVIGLLIWRLVSTHQKPKVDKQLQIIDAYIDSVAKANDLITVSLPINSKKIYKKLIKKLQQDFEELDRAIGSIKGIDKVSHNDFIFINNLFCYPSFKGKEIYNVDGWKLSPSRTLSLMKEWPEAKLEILKIHKQNILDFNHIVNELAGYIT